MPRWIRVPGSLSSISAGGAGLIPVGTISRAATQMIWGTNAKDAVFVRDFGSAAASDWNTVDGSLSRVVVGNTPDASGSCPVWGVNAKQGVFRRANGTWQSVPGALKEIAVGGLGVFGISMKNEIYRYEASGGASPWVAIKGSLSQIDVSDTDIWGVNEAGHVFRGTPSAGEMTWTTVMGSLKHLSVAGALVCGVNQKGELHYTQDAKTWALLSDKVPHKFVRCTTNGQSVWALDHSGNIWLWGD